jgi:2'-5' RNA ligase
VQEIRKRFDSRRAGLPVEITISGSCGLGLISPGQDESGVFAKVAEIARKLEPFETYFTKTESFSLSEIFYFSPAYPEKFDFIHEQIAASGIRFEKTLYPYFTPHCTIKLIKKGNDREIHELLALPPPSDRFKIDTISIYSYCLEKSESNLMFSTRFGK